MGEYPTLWAIREADSTCLGGGGSLKLGGPLPPGLCAGGESANWNFSTVPARLLFKAPSRGATWQGGRRGRGYQKNGAKKD